MATPIRRIPDPVDASADAQRVGNYVRERLAEGVPGLDLNLLSVDAQTRSDHFVAYVFVAQTPLVNSVQGLADGLEAELRAEGYPTSLFVRTWTMPGR